jgi:hypothetical protein
MSNRPPSIAQMPSTADTRPPPSGAWCRACHGTRLQPALPPLAGLQPRYAPGAATAPANCCQLQPTGPIDPVMHSTDNAVVAYRASGRGGSLALRRPVPALRTARTAPDAGHPGSGEHDWQDMTLAFGLLAAAHCCNTSGEFAQTFVYRCVNGLAAVDPASCRC